MPQSVVRVFGCVVEAKLHEFYSQTQTEGALLKDPEGLKTYRS